MFLPCLAKTGGNCQEAVILVEELAVTLKAVGGCEGTEINIKRCTMYNDIWIFTKLSNFSADNSAQLHCKSYIATYCTLNSLVLM